MASLDNITSYLEEYAELKRAKKNIEERMKELDPVIRPVLQDRGDLKVGNYVFSCVTMPGRKSFDKKRLASEHPELDLTEYEKVGAPYTQLKVMELEEEHE